MTNNIATGNGGGILLKGGNSTARNCLVARNTTTKITSSGGGVFVQDNATVEHCTIYGNKALAMNGKDLYLAAGKVRNSIIRPLDPAQGKSSIRKDGGTITYSCVPASGLGETTFVADPILQAPQSNWYELAFGSPCVDAGEALEGVTTDILGRPRPIGTGHDLGCHEMDFDASGDLQISFTANKTQGGNSLDATFTTSVNHGVEPITYEWDFGDGKIVSANVPTMDHLFQTGTYSVTLTAKDAEGKTATMVRTDYISVKPSVAYVALDGGDIWPYETPEKAARSLQTAIDAVNAEEDAPGTVYIAPGVYSETEGKVNDALSPMFLIQKPIRLIGQGTTREDVVLDAKGKCQVLLLGHPGARVENLTMKNGKYWKLDIAGSGNLIMLHGFVTNCVIADGIGMADGNATIQEGTITDCEIRGGEASPGGKDRRSGGLNVRGAAVIENCLFHHNSGGYGGGLNISGAGKDAVVRHCVFFDNTDERNGGGAAAMEGGLLDSCVITNNSSSQYGGGVGLHGNNPIIRNCLIAHNACKSLNNGGGGVYLKAGTIQNCTIVDNTTATISGRELLMLGGTIVNSIVFSTGDTEAGASISKKGGSISYSLVPVAGLGDETNKIGDPLIEEPTANKFALRAGSPCIDAGCPLEQVTTDLTGRKRPVGDGHDIGCYEMDFTSVFAASFQADQVEGVNHLDVTFNVATLNGKPPFVYTWEFGDGTSETIEGTPTTSHAYDQGVFTVKLTVTDAEGQSVVINQPAYIRVRSRVAYVSHDGTSSWPYDTWEKATPVIQDAIDVVQADSDRPGVVYVADGVYGPDKEQAPFIAILQRPVHLIGTNTGHGAVLDANRKTRNILLKHPDAIVANLSCANGTFQGPGPGGVEMEAGMCSNVVIYGSQGFEGGLSMRGGLFTDGVISNCPNWTHAGEDRIGGGACLNGGVVQRTLITNCVNGAGGAVYLNAPSAIVRDCRLFSCENYRKAPVWIREGLVERCLIQANKNHANGTHAASAVCAEGVGSVLRNCLVITNTATWKDGAQFAVVLEKGAKAVNNVVSGNIHGETSVLRGVFNDGGIVMNTIADSIETMGNGGAKANYTGTEPGFRNAKEGDYSLRSSSPCLNAGDNGYWLSIEKPVDFAGNPRIRNQTVDIGAYEYTGQMGTLIMFR